MTEPSGLGLSRYYFIRFTRDKDGNEVPHPFTPAGVWHDTVPYAGNSRGRDYPGTLNEADNRFREIMEEILDSLWDQYYKGECIFSPHQLAEFERKIPVYYWWARAFGLLFWRGKR